MDILHFLKSDHETIRSGLGKLGDTDGIKNRRVLLDELARQVQAHLLLERDYLYPEITDLFPGGETAVEIGLASAALIVRRLKVLQKLAAKTATEQDGYDRRYSEFREAVLKHFDQEEQTLLPKIRYLIRTEDREDLGQVFLDARDDVLKSLDEPTAVVAGGRKRA